jgi:Ca2+-binding EF-hand superfamily protein
MFDREEEGMILASEFSHAIRAMGQTPTEAECNELLQDIDLSGEWG